MLKSVVICVRCSCAAKEVSKLAKMVAGDILTHGYMRNTRVGRDVREVGAPVGHTGVTPLYLSSVHALLTCLILLVL